MTDEQIEGIRAAVDMIQGGRCKRVDADTFTAYKVGDLVRIDIKIRQLTER